MNRLTDSPGWSAITLWLLTLAGVAAASACMVSLTWDGGYYIYNTLQTGSAMIPHHRWINHVLLWPIESLAHLESARPAIMLHGLFCYVPVLLALGYGLVALRGKLEPIRVPFCAALLMGLLPMLMCPTSEVTPAYAGFCLLLAGAWSGCHVVHWPLLVAAIVWMWGSHPASAPLFGLVGAAAIFPAWKGEKKLRPILTGTFFILLAVGKTVDTFIYASDYEKEQFDLAHWLLPMAHVLVCSAWWVIPLSFFYAGAASREDATGRKRARLFFGLMLLVGVVTMSIPILWGGTINYRKFAIATGTFFTAWGTWVAFRTASQAEPATASPPQRRTMLGLGVVFAISMLCGSLCWMRMLHGVTTKLDSTPHPLQTAEAFPSLKWAALDHWSATPTFLVLQGREPSHVFVAAGGKWTGQAVEIFAGEPLPLEDGWFQFGKLRAALDQRGLYAHPAGAP